MTLVQKVKDIVLANATEVGI